MSEHPRESPCPVCAAPHGADARYCLSCGARVAERSVDLVGLLAGRGAVAPAARKRWGLIAAGIASATLAVGVAGGVLLGSAGDAESKTPVATGVPAAPSADAGAPVPTVAQPVAPTSPDDGSVKLPAAGTGSPAPTDAAPVAAGTGPTAAKPAPSKNPVKSAATKVAAAQRELPRIGHVWVIAPTGQDRADLFETGAGSALVPGGTLLAGYVPVKQGALTSAAALVSGAAPATVLQTPSDTTLADQLVAAKKSWRTYGGGAAGCTQGDGDRNPLLHFPSVTAQSDCARRVRSFDALAADLVAPPQFSYVVLPENSQLHAAVKAIKASKAYKADGLIVVAPDAAATAGQPTGALLLSPRVEQATQIDTLIGPFTLLRLFEDLLGVDRLAGAGDAKTASVPQAAFSED